MRADEFDHTCLLATAPATVAPDSHVDILGVAELDGTDLVFPVDYHHPDALTLRMTRAQARHLWHALGRTLDMTGDK